jgi:hypothetical protein
VSARTMKRVLMTQSGFVAIDPHAPAVMAAAMCIVNSLGEPARRQSELRISGRVWVR